MTSASSQKQLSNQSQIVALGDINSYRQLFEKINTKYESASNSLTIRSKLEETTLKNCFQIRIRTKYYDLDSDLVVISTTEEVSNLDDVEDLEGVFILLNSNDEIYYFQNDSIRKLLNENEACFKAVLFNATTNDEIRDLVDTYENLICVDLKPNESDQDESDQDFDGLDEFVNSLFVHSWPNLKMKSASNVNKQSNGEDKTEENLGDEDEDDEENFNFEHMISNLAEMRDKASAMSFEERKLYAEDMVKKFWRSIGGNEDEISDLSS